MVTGEFDRPAGHIAAPAVPDLAFPGGGTGEEAVLRQLEDRLANNKYDVSKNFAITYSGFPAAITRKVEELTAGRFFVEWAMEDEPGTMSLERECVAMMASLLGKGDASGFITTGGTESNIAAMRLARNIGGRDDAEIIGPESMHFSFRLAAELLRMQVTEVGVDTESCQFRVEEVEKALSPRTVGLVCSAPAGLFGTMDPIEEMADLAWRKGLYLHVDAAFGGFILPFMKDLGYHVPPYDLSLPGVSSISTDGHKLGLLPIATGFFLARDASVLEAVPTEETFIHTTSSTKPGSRAASAWATMRHLGRTGYQESTRHVLGVRDVIVEGVTSIPGVRVVTEPFITVLGFTSDTVDMEAVHKHLDAERWGHTYDEIRGLKFIRLSIHPSRTEDAGRGFAEAFRVGAERA